MKHLTIDHIKDPHQLGIALKRLRKNLGLSQKDLAIKMNMRQPTISDIENGRGTLDSFFKIIQAMQINLSLSNDQSVQKNKSSISKMISLLDD